jgi:metal-dependent amidase/aminoacylase/carboxypeptidase family protein
VVFEGREAHAVAAPEKGINALTALLRLFAGVERLLESATPEVRIPGIVVEGGHRANVVPGRAVGRFSLRARDLATLARLEKAFREVTRRAARSVGARAHIRFIDLPYAHMRTNRVMADLFKAEMRDLGRTTIDTPRKSMGSLDMGNVSQVVPSIHPYVAVAPPGTPLHSRPFARYAGSARGRAGLDVATQALARTALVLLDEPHRLDQARREFREGDGGAR